jgi:hypothetical protein
MGGPGGGAAGPMGYQPGGPAVGPMGYQDVTLGRRSKAVTLSIISAFAWIIPLFGFPFCLTALGVALRDRKPGSSRLVPSWVLPLTLIALGLCILNSIWGAEQGAHCQGIYAHFCSSTGS